MDRPRKRVVKATGQFGEGRLASPGGPDKGQPLTEIPVTLGETVGNTYPVLAGLKPGDKVITSGLQFLQEGAPVKPLG